MRRGPARWLAWGALPLVVWIPALAVGAAPAGAGRATASAPETFCEAMAKVLPDGLDGHGPGAQHVHA